MNTNGGKRPREPDVAGTSGYLSVSIRVHPWFNFGA